MDTQPHRHRHVRDRGTGAVTDLTSADRRYEPYVPPISGPIRRVASSWSWVAPGSGTTWAVHVEHVGAEDAPLRLMLVHGAGGNAAAMWPYAAHLSRLGARVTVVDLPGYGRTTRVTRGRRGIRYDDWRHLLSALVTREHDDRPLVLVGASMGGMLAVDAAVLSGLASRVVATCLLDPSQPQVTAGIVRAPWLARWGLPLLGLARGPLAEIPLRIRLLTPMAAIANDPGLSREVLSDGRGGGGAMPLGWYRSFVEAQPVVAPERYDGPPVVLLHPEQDRWTHPELSLDFLSRLSVATRSVLLPNCGHFPLERPGFRLFLSEVAVEIAAVLQADAAPSEDA